MTTVKPSRFCYRAFEFRNDVTGDGHTLEGYAAVFNAPTRIDSWEGTFDEQIAPGAFKKTLRERTPVLQFDHGHDARTGSVPIGSIQEIREDDHGLFVNSRMYDNAVVEPIRQAIEGGSIDGMSFRFRVLNDVWRDKDGKPVKPGELAELLWESGDRGPLMRTIREVELFELGPVVFPAYDNTSVGVRSMLAGLDEPQRERLVTELSEAILHRAEDVTEEPPDETPEDEKRTGPLPPLNEWLAAHRAKQT